MGLLVISVVFVLTVAVGAVLARGVLALLLRIMTAGNLRTTEALRTAAFVGALLAFWSLAPAIAGSSAASGLLALMR